MIDRCRLTSRVLVIDDDDRMLMFFTKGSVPAQRTRWITPGGGVDAGETHHDAACRELFEETGHVVDDLGKPVFTLDFTVDYSGGDHDTGHAEYFVVHTPAFIPADTHWTPEERVDVLDHRWWTLDELRATTEPFEPAELVDLFALEIGAASSGPAVASGASGAAVASVGARTAHEGTAREGIAHEGEHHV